MKHILKISEDEVMWSLAVSAHGNLVLKANGTPVLIVTPEGELDLLRGADNYIKGVPGYVKTTCSL